IATPWIPFDLHVLSTPPAFVLSQDQTLRQELPVSVKYLRIATEQVEFWKVRVGIVSLSAYPHQRFLTNQ
ncbi:MAG: hypothetical protein RL200_865, partial [Actinomycetota bacterium]